jgi:hypothetical protein
MANALKQKFHAAFRVGAKPEASTADHDSAGLVKGARTINRTARKVLAEIKKHVEDQDSPFHLDALKRMFDRALPLKTVSSEAVRLLRSGALGDDSVSCDKPKRKYVSRRNNFAVNVHVTTGPRSDSEEEV